MRSYWIKIGAGAFGIFAVGMLVVTGFRRVHSRVDEVVNGSGELAIPLMGIVPLSIEGSRLGRLNKLLIERDAPKHVTSVVLVARLDDSVDSDRFDGCDFTVGNLSHIDEHTTFTCLDSVPAGMREFGTVRFVDSDGDTDLERPLVLTERDIADIQNSNGNSARTVQINVDSIQASAESAGAAARRMADSIRQVMQARYGKGGSRVEVTPAPAARPAKVRGHAAPRPHPAPKSAPTPPAAPPPGS